MKLFPVELVNCPNIQDAVKQRDGLYNLIIHDPPFDWEPGHSLGMLNHYERMMANGANLILINYLHSNLCLLSYLSTRSNLTAEELVIFKMGTAKPRMRGLWSQHLTALIFYKGPKTERIFYANKNVRGNGQLYSPEANGVITDIWDDRRYYPCRRRGGKVVHKGAMPFWVAERIIDCFARPGDKVYDSFGGAGTFPAVCRRRGIHCRSVEIDTKNHLLACKEVLSYKKSKLALAKDAEYQAFTAEHSMEGKDERRKEGTSKEDELAL